VRICLLTREFPPVTRYTGGIGTQYASLSAELARQGHDVHVLTAADQPRRAGEVNGPQLHLLPRPPRRIALEDWLWSRAADGALRRLGPFDIVYAAEYGGDAAGYSRRRTAGPLVTNLVTSTEQILEMSPGRRPTARERLAHVVLRHLERRQTERSDALAPCTHAILEWTRRLWKVDGLPARVLPNMVDVERTRALASGPPPDGFPQDGQVIAFSGRIEIRKGAHVLAAAMPRVWEAQPGARLVLMGRDMPFGHGTMAQHVRRMAGRHADRVHVLGNQPPERLFAALARADAVALPSLWENFALASLEVLALGRPLVATAVGGFPEFITDGQDGLLVAPGDAPALAGALTRLLGDAALRERLGAAAARTAEAYAPEPVTRRHVDWFETVASGG
jgi:glycosyltransferase involved in cell wall biosynthesis